MVRGRNLPDLWVPDYLATMLQLAGLHELDAGDALRRVANIEAALSVRGVGFAKTIASSLPKRLAKFAAEVTLAGLALRVTYLGPRLPSDLASLDGAAAHRWDGVVLCLHGAAGEEWDDVRVLRALSGGDVSFAARPEELLRRCAAAQHPDLALLALEWTQRAVAHCILEPTTALGLVETLVTHREAVVRTAALRGLGESWLGCTPSVRRVAMARVAVTDEDDVAMAALDVVAAAGDVVSLRPLVAEGTAPVADRALALLGRCGDSEDLRRAIAMASERSAPSLREHIIAMHRQGVFVVPESASTLLDSFDAHHGWTADEFNRVTFTARDQVLTGLSSMGADDPRWQRGASLLPGCEGRVGATTAGELLRARLRETSSEANAAALLAAAAEAPEANAEEATLRWLDRLPEASLRALRVHGASAAATALLERLEGPLAFGSARRQALSTLWWITDDPGEVLARIDARELTAAQAANPLADPATIARVLSRIPNAPAIQRFSTLVKLGPSPGGEDVQRLFRAAFLEGLPRRGPRRRSPATPADVEQQARRFGARLAACGRRPGRFGDEGANDEAAWLRGACLGWLMDDLDSSDTQLAVRLLETLGRCELRPVHVRYIHRLWRHRDEKVRRAAMETLIGAGATGLTLSLCSLASTTDLRASRQALRAIAVFAAQWAEPLAIEALGSPNMNIKKAAAEALCTVGSARSLPAIIDWLGQSDNPGLRKSLVAAFCGAAGDATNGLLVSAFEAAPRDRAGMLLRALNQRLTTAQLLGVLRGRRSAGPALRRAVLDDELTLAGGNEEFRRAIHEGACASADVERAARVAFEGSAFSAAGAQALVEALDEVPLTLVAARLPEWAEWATTLEGDLARHVGFVVLRAVAASAQVHASAVLHLAPAMQTPAERSAALLALEGVAPADARTRHRALVVTRELGSVDAEKRWRALVRLGGGISREDLERCLVDARPDAVAEQFLRSALRIGGGPEPLLERVLGAPTAARREALGALVAEYPLGIVAPPLRPSSSTRRTKTREELIELLATEQGAAEAAVQLLADPDARESWALVLTRYLDGGFPLREGPRLAQLLTEWPPEAERAKRAARLVGFLPPRRRRRWIPRWLDRWSEGDQAAGDALARTSREDVVAALAERDALDDERWVRALTFCPVADGDLSRLQDERLAEGHPLFACSAESDPLEDDPLADVDGVAALSAYVQAHRGQEAARAVGRLGLHGADSLDAILHATKHADALVRTVALRWLRRVAPRTTRLEVALHMLRVERQRDLRRQLVRILAHGRYVPAYPLLITLLFDPDAVVARTTEAALLQLGAPVLPALRKAAARARPDRRDIVEELTERIAGDENQR